MERSSRALTAVAVLAVAAGVALQMPSPVKVIDGDTVERYGLRFRLVGWDSPEIGRARCASERAAGRQAAARLRELVEGSADVRLRLERVRPDVWGRFLARLEVDGRDVAPLAIAEGWGVPYDGRTKRRDWCAT